MILINFSVRNHKSIRDEVDLDLQRSTLRTLVPKAGSWSDYVYPIAGIFGANASGKSNILDALLYFFTAVRLSATNWQAFPTMVRAPFLLDEHSEGESSSYEIDFVSKDRRYSYGFEVGGEGILHEYLRDIPSSRWRTLFERTRGEARVKTHSTLKSVGSVTDRELVLSRALLLKHEQLCGIAEDLLDSFDVVQVKDTHREKRLHDIAESLVEGSITALDIELLLQIADIGIEKVAVEERNLPEKFRKAVQQFQRAISEEDDEPDEVLFFDELEEEDSDLIVRNLLFTHKGETAESPAFSIEQESDGTIAWLALMVPAVETLRTGGLLCIDEIDSSLHPHLLDIVLRLFSDPTYNTNHAQLIFTSHETFLLSPLSEVDLAPEQVWFTDKSYEGVTELTSLADYPSHPDANVAKRYLLGRYGGTPRVAPSLLSALFDPDGE